MKFDGWSDEDFEIFGIPDFAGRMAAIRGRLKPRLALLGEELAEPLTAALGSPALPHVAQHMRRRVNPPPATWTAWGRDRRGYKRWTHLRLSVNREGVRLVVFVEDDADDKPVMGESLASRAASLIRRLENSSGLTLYQPGEPQPFKTKSLAWAGGELLRLKGAHFQGGTELPANEAADLSADDFGSWVLEQASRLAPLYQAGLPRELRPRR